MGLSGNVFVTGGAGFLARALYTRARLEGWPCRFTAFSRDDHKHAALLRDFPEVACVRGDVAGDADMLAAAMAGHQLVIHAAAAKHVDLAEYNVWDTKLTNVDGSQSVAWAAIKARVARVIGISTDKVCHPVNTYGLTKALMERLFIEADRLSDLTEFVLTRYGNVLGSTGSVLTVWKAMLAKDGFVSATDPEMTRFWLTGHQAVNLILIAAGAPAGTITIPRAPALAMSDMRAWFLPAAEFRYGGLRPGEKRYEELLAREEAPFASLPMKNPYEVGAYFHWLNPQTSDPLKLGIDDYRSDRPDRFLARDELAVMVAA
jgi:UDP-N-acetylglucosamine 4,6-dehydratase